MIGTPNEYAFCNIIRNVYEDQHNTMFSASSEIWTRLVV